MKESINEHDMTKKMMNVIRGGYKSLLIKEADEMEQEPQDFKSGDNTYKKDGTITLGKEDPDFKSDEEDLATIDPTIEINSIIIYPNVGDVVLSGKFLNGSSIFEMKLKEEDVKLDPEGSISFSDTDMDIIEKLKGYFINWQNKWRTKIRDTPKYQNK